MGSEDLQFVWCCQQLRKNYTASNNAGHFMNNELERMWKEALATQFSVLSRNLPGEQRKTTKNFGSCWKFI